MKNIVKPAWSDSQQESIDQGVAGVDTLKQLARLLHSPVGFMCCLCILPHHPATLQLALPLDEGPTPLLTSTQSHQPTKAGNDKGLNCTRHRFLLRLNFVGLLAA